MLVTGFQYWKVVCTTQAKKRLGFSIGVLIAY
jgi:hypothetical protein